MYVMMHFCVRIINAAARSSTDMFDISISYVTDTSCEITLLEVIGQWEKMELCCKF